MTGNATSPPAARWEHFTHEADIGVRGLGPTKAAAFEQAALALIAVMTPPETVRPVVAVDFDCQAPDDEQLLVAWLDAIIFEVATRKLLFGRFAAQLTAGCLRATGWGEPVDVVRHQPAVEIKGATYTELRVGQTASGEWVAQCVVDV
jgi:SHS2 domain-containing protein